MTPSSGEGFLPRALAAFDRSQCQCSESFVRESKVHHNIVLWTVWMMKWDVCVHGAAYSFTCVHATTYSYADTEISARTSLFNCNLSNIIIAGEKRIGFISHFKFKCELCGTYFLVSSDDPNNTKNVDINTAVCSGIVATDIGYSQLEEICSAMDVPIFKEKYFAKVQSQVYDDWEATAVEAMEAAAGREYDAAIAEGRVKDGISVIDVYVDGAWCVNGIRSYGNNYRALSGVAAIVERRFAHGIENENIALQQLAKQENIEIEPYGLFIDPEIDFLGDSPDGVIRDDTVVEVQFLKSRNIVLTGVVGTDNRYTVASKQRARKCAIVTMYFASLQTVQRPTPAPL
ncbi:hypothetical protein EVAR_45659_1 [Eumeta japonica]|uniref:Mutator-like transposase domain-containing protein n=1 Tax=Eumeta variegata TaxID=151549 RepID=A0A4C1Y6C9_EUMVA|nr:hypothetical protein EVAR_45659_1 [Eumeta japonica]